MDRFRPYDDPASPFQLRERLEAFGQVSAELLHDLAEGMAALEMRARLAAAEARAGRPPGGDLDRVVETSTELGAMLRDVLDALRGRTTSPEVTFQVYPVLERAVRWFLPATRPVEVRLISHVDPALEVHGRASFLFRSVWNLLANAMHYCRREVWIDVSLEEPRRMDEDAAAVLCIDVEDDGAGLDPMSAAELFEPMADTGDPEGGLGLSGVAWMVEQMGGWVRHRPGEALGGARFEIRLPVAATTPAG
ncbi:MAG TPA: sensor histidine kinase [Longimicrobium sp.]|jgi:signal transduction histidine kinase